MEDVCEAKNLWELNVKKGSKYNTIKLLELYGDCKDTLEDLIVNREQYQNDDPAFEVYRDIFYTYDCAMKVKDVDRELCEVLLATCYFKIYTGISDTSYETFMDEKEDVKGKVVKKINYNSVIKYLTKKYCIISYNEAPFLYIGSQYYCDARRARLKKDLTKIFEALEFSDHTNIGNITKDIIERIISSTHKLNKYPFNHHSSELIPVMNGVVHRKTMTLLPNSPAFGMLYHLNAKYNPTIQTNVMAKYLNSLVETPEDAEILLQIPAQALIQNEQHQLAYLMTGDGKNGKSTLITVYQTLVGSDNYCTTSLQDLTENRFAKAELEGKLLNLYPDLNKNAVKFLGTLKALTGSDEIDAERKFGQPFKLRNKAVLAFSANELPEVHESTYAFWRRWCVIPFPNRFESDPNFLKNLMSEDNMSELLNLVIAKMNRIDEFGLTKSKRVDEAMNMWKSRSSSAYAFVCDCIVKNVHGSITKDNLMNLYAAYCEEKDVTVQDIKNVVSELQKMGVQTSRTRNGQKMEYVYKGCEYVKQKEEEVVENIEVFMEGE